MFIISLHKVKIVAPLGLYPQEWVLGNRFEVDVDVSSAESSYEDGRFVDYTVLNAIIQSAFTEQKETLENVSRNIHASIVEVFPFIQKARVCVRKMNPPMAGDMEYAQVVFER